MSGEWKLNNSNSDISDDGRVTVLLFFMFGLLLFDFSYRHHWSFLDGNYGYISGGQLTFLRPDKLVVENCSDAGREQNHKPVPARYSPLFFELIPINQANKDILMTVSGVGPALAASIVEYRNEFGSFKKSKDLQNLKGIGSKRATKFAAVFTFSEVP